LQLKIPTRAQGFESLSYYGGRIFEASQESTTMDIVKFMRKVPLVFCIINLEAAICRNTLSSAEMQTTAGFYSL
jgi:hypothetical protein